MSVVSSFFPADSEATILLETTPSWQSAGSFSASAVAAAEIHRNRHTDLVLGHRGHETEVYFNRTSRFDEQVSFGTGTINDTIAIAVADMNGDRLPDLIHGNRGQFSQLFLHDGFRLSRLPIWTASVTRLTTSVAVADLDGDGDLDLALGNSFQRNQIYSNDGQGNLGVEPIWTSADAADTQDIAWADIDGDGFPDLLVANSHSLQLFHNDSGMLETQASWEVSIESAVRSLAPGDLDGDGFPDLAVATTNQNLLFCNRAGVLETTPCWLSADSAETNAVAWGDADADGDLDLAAANNGPNVIYENQEGMLLADPAWFSADERNTQAVLWFDNGDGDPDLAAANDRAPSVIYANLQDANTPPVAIPGPNQVIFLDSDGLASTLLDGSASFDDDPETTLRYQWIEASDNPELGTILEPQAATTTFATRTSGVYNLFLQVSDGIVESVPVMITVRVEAPGNAAPVVFAGQDQTIALSEEVAEVTLSEAQAGDFDGDELTFQWQEDPRNPRRGLLSDPAILQPSFTPLLPGAYRFTLTASDGLVPSEPSTVTIIVDLSPSEHVPIARTSNDIRTETGSEVVLSGAESADPDPADTLTFAWFDDPANPFAFGQLTGVESMEALFRPRLPGQYTFSLVVNDGFLASAPDTVAVQVNAKGNSVPVAKAPGGTIRIAPRTKILLDGSKSTDADNDPLIFRWIEDPANPELGTLAEPHAAQTIFRATKRGTYLLRLTVNDGIIDSEAAVVTIRIVSGSSLRKGDDNGGFCFIASLASGSPLQHWLGPLRSVRDRLLHYGAGRFLVRWYYQRSPALAQFVDHYPWLRLPLRIILLLFVGLSWVAMAQPMWGILVMLLLFYTLYRHKLHSCPPVIASEAKQSRM